MYLICSKTHHNYTDNLDNFMTNSRSAKSQSAQLDDCDYILNHGNITTYLYTKQKPNANRNSIDR